MSSEQPKTDQSRRSFLRKTAAAGTVATGLTFGAGSAVAGGGFRPTWRGINQGSKGLIVVDVGDIAVADSFNNWRLNVLTDLDLVDLDLNVSKVDVVDDTTVKILTNSLNDNEIEILNKNDVDIEVCAFCKEDGRTYCGTCTA